MTTDFFAAQRRQRIRSRMLIGAIFALLWTLANGVLVFAHIRPSCPPVGQCKTIWYANPEILAITALAVGGYLVIGSWWASRTAIVGQGVRPADGLEGLALRNVVNEMSIAAGVRTPLAYIVDDPSLNAFAVSDGRRGGAVVVTSGLLAALDRSELAGVVAHEISHIRNRDSRVILVAVVAVGAIALASSAFAVAASSSSGRRDDDKDNGGAALIAILVGLLLMAVAVPIAMLMRAALSRRREQLADASAVQWTRDPGGLRRALEKIGEAGPSPRHITMVNRTLWINAPVVGGGLIARLLDTRPPLEQRVAWLRTLERAQA